MRGAEGLKKILVTGGAGYVGSHACKALAQAGYEPIIYDNLSTGYIEFVKWGQFYLGDLLDFQRLRQVFRDEKPVAVMHFAAKSTVAESQSSPHLYYQNNVAGSLNLLECMREFGVKSMVFSSTCAVYGNSIQTPMMEDHPQLPTSVYGQSKAMIERMLFDFDRAYGIRSIILRYFNASGADPEGDLGESHQPETHLIPVALEVALGKRESLELFGEDYPTPDGTCIRDYIHVSDLASAHILALDQLLKKGQSQIYNLGTGQGYSVKQVIECIERVTKKNLKVISSPRRAGDSAILVASADRARNELRWRVKYPHLEEHVRHAWSWYLKATHRS